MVHPVAEVDIGDAPLLIHHLGAPGPPSPVGVARSILFPFIRFGFDDEAAGEDPPNVRAEPFAEKGASDEKDVFSLVEATL